MNENESLLTEKGVASIARNTSYLVGGRVINIIMRLVYAVVLARYLGPELYGIFNYGISWYLAFFPLANFGLAIILSREIGRQRSNGPLFVAQTFTLRIFMAIASSILCAAIGWLSEGEPQARLLLVIFAITLTGRSLAAWTDGVFTAYESSKYCFRQHAIFRPLEIIFGLAALLSGGGIYAVAAVHMLSWWLQTMKGLALVRRHMSPLNLSWRLPDQKNILIQCVPVVAGHIAVNWFLHGPLVLYRHIVAENFSLGQLALAVQVLSVAAYVPNAAMMASLPVMSRSVARDTDKDLFFVGAVVRAAIIIGTALGLLCLVIGPWIVNIIFGEEFREAGHLIGLVLFLLIPWTCGNAMTIIYQAKGKFLLSAVIAGIGAAVFTLILPWFVSVTNVAGAIFAADVGMSVWVLILAYMLSSSRNRLLGRAVLRPSALMILAVGVFVILKSESIWLAIPASWMVLIGGAFLFRIITRDECLGIVDLLRRKVNSKS